MTNEPETSRKMIRRALWGSAQTEEETRAYLQERVTLLFKLMFWSLFALMAFLAITFTTDDDNAPFQRKYVYASAVIGLSTMAFIWRGLLVRRELSIDTLYRLDLVYSFFIGLAFGLAAYLQDDLAPSGYLSVIYSTFTVFSRTLIIPSTWRRTLATSALTYAPMTVTAAALAFSPELTFRTERWIGAEHWFSADLASNYELAFRSDLDMPGLMFFIGYLLFSVAPIVLATAGSWIIYGLTQKASAAQLGSYTLDRKIGAGGMGTVYLAHHVLLRRPTAVKLINATGTTPDALERFEREVQHMSQLTHPNSVAVFDYGHSLDGRFYYAMEYLGGGVDLEDLVRRHGPQPSGRVASILAQVCGALHEAHLAKLIHRDVKPANIILCERGGMPDFAKVLDYGLVKDFTVDRGQTGQVVVGTPGFLAPEAVTDPGNITASVDIYALGAVGYFLLTGQQMFTGKTAVEVCIAHVTKEVTPPSQVIDRPIAPALEALILKCLAKAPGDRFATALELRAALLALPPSADWNVSHARTWWQDYRGREQKASDSAQLPTMTMQVDLAAADRT